MKGKSSILVGIFIFIGVILITIMIFNSIKILKIESQLNRIERSLYYDISDIEGIASNIEGIASNIEIYLSDVASTVEDIWNKVKWLE